MNKLLLLVLCLFSMIKSYSQVNIGKSKSPFNLYVSSLTEKEFKIAKNATTYFVVPNQLNYEDVKKHINEIYKTLKSKR